MGAKEENLLEKWEQKILRATCAEVNRENRRTNRELEQLYKELSIIKYIKGQRLG